MLVTTPHSSWVDHMMAWKRISETDQEFAVKIENMSSPDMNDRVYPSVVLSNTEWPSMWLIKQNEESISNESAPNNMTLVVFFSVVFCYMKVYGKKNPKFPNVQYAIWGQWYVSRTVNRPAGGWLILHIFPCLPDSFDKNPWTNHPFRIILPKFNMEPKNEGFQSRNLLFPGCHPFSGSMLNFGRVTVPSGQKFHGDVTFRLGFPPRLASCFGK